MPMSSEQFQEIIGSLRSDPLFGRRAAPRVGFRLRIRIIPCVEAGPVKQYDAWLRDVSTGGMCFVGPVELAPGTFLVTQFARDEASPLTILYEVVRCQPRSKELFEVGARMDRVLSDEEIKGE
jgi:hypothetical protein